MKDAVDENLMQAFGRGDTGAFERLYARYKGPVYRFILRQLNDRGTAEELFQEVWTGVIAGRRGYRPSGRFSTWLFTLARRRVADHYRRRGAETVEFVDDAHGDSATDPGEVSARRQAVGRLLDAVRALPDDQREAFLLREEAGLSLDEIAEVTRVKRETAKSRLRYAVARLRDTMGATP